MLLRFAVGGTAIEHKLNYLPARLVPELLKFTMESAGVG